MSKESDYLEAEAALAKLLARYAFWDSDERRLKEALEILRKGGK